MGVTIRCVHGRSADLGYGGFERFRSRVAWLHSEAFGAHYDKLIDLEVQLLEGEAAQRFTESFNSETAEMIQSKKVNIKVVDFCLQPNSAGKIRYGACKVILDAINDYNDNLVYGYTGRPDRAMFSDLRDIIAECTAKKCDLVWS